MTRDEMAPADLVHELAFMVTSRSLCGVWWCVIFFSVERVAGTSMTFNDDDFPTFS
jgi:hypothetical protein